MNCLEILGKCTVEGQIVKLPNEKLERKVYQEVAKTLELIGGKWKGGNVQGFIFNHDPSELLYQVQNGEKRNLKKEFQFFATPQDLAETLVEMAFVNQKIAGKILEPSAGQGAIINAIHKLEFSQLNVRYCELNEINRTFLEKIPYTEYLGEDFLKLQAKEAFATIIANPPFNKNQDIDHIYKMYECLKPGGRIVSIASKHWQHASGKKEKVFSDWLETIGAEIHEIEAGAFKKSGTMVSSVIIVINKN